MYYIHVENVFSVLKFSGFDTKMCSNLVSTPHRGPHMFVRHLSNTKTLSAALNPFRQKSLTLMPSQISTMGYKGGNY